MSSLNESCGTAVTLAVDWKSFEHVDLSNHSVTGFCGEPIQSLTVLCGNFDAKKPKVKAKIKTITCTYAGKRSAKEQTHEPEIKELTLKAGVLAWRFNWNALDVVDYNGEFFHKNL